MSEHYIVTVDRGHLRVYAENRVDSRSTPSLEVVESMDFPEGKHSYTDQDTDMAGRFPGSKGRGDGMSIDERLPMKRETERRNIQLVASELNTFLQNRPNASWDLAAAPSMYRMMIDELSPDVRRRLKRALPKDLVNQRADELRAHFATADRG